MYSNDAEDVKWPVTCYVSGKSFKLCSRNESLLKSEKVEK